MFFCLRFFDRWRQKPKLVKTVGGTNILLQEPSVKDLQIKVDKPSCMFSPLHCDNLGIRTSLILMVSPMGFLFPLTTRLMTSLFAFISFLNNFSICLMFPPPTITRIFSQINYLYLNIFLKISFWGTNIKKRRSCCMHSI